MCRFSSPRKALLPLGLGIAVLLCSETAWAQSQSLFGSQSLGSRGGTSNSLFGNSSGARGSRGQNSSVMGSGFLQTTNLGEISSLMNQGFIGRGNNTNGFVGRSATGSGFNQGQSFRRQNTFGSGRRGNRNSESFNSDFNDSAANGAGSAARMLIRPRHEVAFEYPRPEAGQMTETLRARLSDVTIRHPEFSGLEIIVADDNGEVTLRGTVPTERASKLAEAMLRLEPGVRAVRNELSIAAASAPDSIPAPPAPANP